MKEQRRKNKLLFDTIITENIFPDGNSPGKVQVCNQKWYLLYFLVFRFQDIGGKIELSVDQPNLKSPEGKIILKVILKSHELPKNSATPWIGRDQKFK